MSLADTPSKRPSALACANQVASLGDQLGNFMMRTTSPLAFAKSLARRPSALACGKTRKPRRATGKPHAVGQRHPWCWPRRLQGGQRLVLVRTNRVPRRATVILAGSVNNLHFWFLRPASMKCARLRGRSPRLAGRPQGKRRMRVPVKPISIPAAFWILLLLVDEDAEEFAIA